MKKLMIAAALVCACMLNANAAKVNWSFTDTVTSTYYANSADLGGYKAYLFLASTWDGIAEPAATDLASALVKEVAFSKTIDDGSKRQYQIAPRLDGIGNVALGDQQFKIILSDGLKYWESASVTGTVLADDDNTQEFTTATVSLKGANYIQSSAVATLAPEPTSGLLLLLGVAGLALRRRRA